MKARGALRGRARKIHFSAVKGRKMNVSLAPPWGQEHAWGSFPVAGATPVLDSFMRSLVSLTEKISIFGGLVQNRFYGGF